MAATSVQMAIAMWSLYSEADMGPARISASIIDQRRGQRREQ